PSLNSSENRRRARRPPLPDRIRDIVSTSRNVSTETDQAHGGGGAVKADRTAAGPWETFRLVDWNSGGLRDGDVVSFRAHNYPTSAASMRAIGGGGGSVDAAGTSWDDDAYFIFRTAGPGSIGVGDAVYLQTI